MSVGTVGSRVARSIGYLARVRVKAEVDFGVEPLGLS